MKKAGLYIALTAVVAVVTFAIIKINRDDCCIDKLFKK